MVWSSPLHLLLGPAAPATGVGGRPGPGSALGPPPSRQRPPWGCWAWWWWLGGVEPPVTGLYGLGATYWVEGTETRCNGQRPITANGVYRLQHSHWTLTHQPFTDLDCHRLQVGHPQLVLDTYALHVRPPQRVGVRSQGSIGRAPLYPVGVRGARYHGQGSWAGECGSPGSLGKGELGSWSERAHNPIAQETAISIQCRAASQ